MLEKQLQLMQLQSQLSELEAAKAAKAIVPQVVAPPPAAVVEQIAPAIVQPPPPAFEALPAAIPDAAASAVVTAASSGLPFGLPGWAGVVIPLVLAPVGYFGVTAFVKFVNERYDELQGGESSDAARPGGPRFGEWTTMPTLA